MMGASYAIGLDILLERFIGLETADIFIQRDGLYFERVLGDMNNLPVRPDAFDVVFMTGTLHHSSDSVRTIREVAQALVPGGVAIVINEPVRSLMRSEELTGCPEIEHGINEHVYTIFGYLWAVWRAGLRPRLFFPHSISKRLDHGERGLAQEMGAFGYRVVSRLGRRAMRGPLLPAVYLIASMPLVMLASKPAG
jgi:SAM-dependent methyltransferase